MNAIRRTLNPARAGVLFVSLLLLFACTEKTYITNPPPVIPDQRPPQVEWVSVNSGADLNPPYYAVYDTVTLTVSAADESGVDSLKLYINGFPRFSLVFASPPPAGEAISFTWNTLSDSDGVYSLEARAWDKAGNVGVSPALILNVRNDLPPSEDRFPPQVEWVSINGRIDFQSVVSDTVTLTVSASDESGVDSLKLYINGFPRFFTPPPTPPASEGGKTGFPTACGGDEGGVFSFLWPTLSDSDGVYSLEARAWDKAGNVGVSPVLSLRVSNTTPPPEDRLPPDLWWESPAGGATLSDTVRLIVRYFDESGVDSIWLSKDGVLVGRTVVRPTAERGTIEYLWDTRNDSDGVHLWEARGWDAARNAGVSAGLLVRVQNNPEPPPQDVRPPVIVWRSPTPGDTLQGRVELRFDVMDDDRVDSARVYINGGSSQNLLLLAPELHQTVIWLTTEWSEGSYVIDVRAWDRSGNVGASVGVTFRVWNNRPRVIWVPDHYGTIQGAINASVDGDTVRVRAGTYREGLRIAKRIWLESETGPEETVIDAASWGFGIGVFGVQDTVSSAVRGFTIRNSDMDGIYLYTSASIRIMNNIILNAGRASVGFFEGFVTAAIVNNIFAHSGPALYLYNCAANVSNNILFDISGTVFFNTFIYGNPVVPDYNLAHIYRVRTNDPPIRLGEHNIFDQDPLFIEGSYRLSGQSPAVDSGNPDLLDPDGTRSDMGAYGGPHAYR